MGHKNHVHKALPVLEVYYIDFGFEKQLKKHNISTVNTNFSKPVSYSEIVPKDLLKDFLAIAILAVGNPYYYLIHNIKKAFRLIKADKYNVISSPEALKQFKNGCGNEWVNSDSDKKRQYYFRHPKKAKNNILIETQAFYNYIEQEQKDEIVDFILSHCPAKEIRIDRYDNKQVKIGANAAIKNANVKVGFFADDIKGNYISCSNPKGTMQKSNRNEYVWLENSLMNLISSLKEGGDLTDQYIYDFTFGLTASEAKTFGVDAKYFRKYFYRLYIKC